MSDLEREVLVILLYWDPIGVLGHGYEVEEYQGYVPQIVEMIQEGATEEKLFSHLSVLEGTVMGLSKSSSRTREAARRLAKI